MKIGGEYRDEALHPEEGETVSEEEEEGVEDGMNLLVQGGARIRRRRESLEDKARAVPNPQP